MAASLHLRSPFDLGGFLNIDEDDDPRVGSTRNDTDGGGTLSQTNGSTGSSLSKLGATFIPISIYVVICLIIFIILRRKWHRVYAPRTISALRAPERPTPALPDGWFNWIVPFFKIPDTVVLNNGSLDGFFFLRFLKVLRNICFAGCCIAWPILFPINATGGGGQKELSLLTMANVLDPKKLYAHAVVAWLLFGFVLFTVAREYIYYINLRQAYLSSPYYSQRLSSRTVLFTSVPERYLDEARMRKLYGDGVRHVWIPRTSKGLVNLVKEREQTAMRLEKAEIMLIRNANLVRNKQTRAEEKERKKENDKEKKMTLRGRLQRRKGYQNHDHDHDQNELAMAEKGQALTTGNTAQEHPKRSSSRTTGRESDPTSYIPPIAILAEQTTTTHNDSTHSANSAEINIDFYQQDYKSLPADVLVEHEQRNEDAAAWTKTGNHIIASEVDSSRAGSDAAMRYVHPYGLSPSLPDVRGSVAAQYLPVERRPHHRPLGNFGRRVDTIRWTRTRLEQLNKRISKLRRQVLRGVGQNCQTIPVAFVEFDTQEAAQAAHQTLAHHQPLHMAPRLLGIRPEEVVWSSLRIGWLERIVRRFAILGLIVAAIIFWSIPSAIVGIVSNVQAMSKIVFLTWLNKLPGPILGFLTGFIPALALSLFMALVPVLLRHAAVIAGVPSVSKVELFTQTSYFAFQVIQVFLVTTLTSAASGAIIEVLLDPKKAMDVLAANLPLSSNFYISYILIQCLANAGTTILRPFDAVRHAILGRVAQLPRSHYRLWRYMRPARWGRDFPVFTNLGVIALAYACIAPLILIFAAVGMAFTHMVWRYNLLFVLDADFDSSGLFYPRALMHLIVGLYLAEICMIGLLFINNATGPAVLTILLLIFTGLVHFSIHQSMAPMVQNLPQTLALEEEIQQEEKDKAAAARRRAEEGEVTDGAANTYFDEDEEFGDAEDDIGRLSDAESYEEDEEDNTPDPVGNRAVEGAADFRLAFTSWFQAWTMTAVKEQVTSLGFNAGRNDDPEKPPSLITRWLRPHIHEDFIAIRKNLMELPESLPETSTNLNTRDYRHAYLPPEMWTPRPVLWIPQDDARVSRQEVAHTKKYTPIHDTGARLDENGRVVVENIEEAPIAVPRVLL